LAYYNKGSAWFIITKTFFAYVISRKKTSEQSFLGKTKPTCQNSAIFEHFKKWKFKHAFSPYDEKQKMGMESVLL